MEKMSNVVKKDDGVGEEGAFLLLSTKPTSPPNNHLTLDHPPNLKHAQTEGHFQGIVPSGLQQDASSRFDSHNILRSDETNDLLQLDEEDGKIWLKRNVHQTDSNKEEERKESSVASVNGVIVDGLLDGRPVDRDQAPLSTASITALVLKSPHHTREDDDISNIIRPELETRDHNAYYEDGSISVQSKSATTDGGGEPGAGGKKKSLTRRLSSFFSRSFRRKSRPAQAKRVSYAESGAATEPSVHRPASADTNRSLQESSSELGLLRSQQLLRLGFSLNINEALKNEPDTFLFVSLTESGYFSAKFNEFEKLHAEDVRSVVEEPASISPPETPATSPQSPPQSFASRDSDSLPATKHSPKAVMTKKAHNVPNSATMDSMRSAPVRLATNHDSGDHDHRHLHSQSTKGHTSPRVAGMDGPRRLSFMEGTSVMESINHLAYPDQEDQSAYPHSSFSDDNLSHARPPTLATRQAKKLKFKKHPWRWIKSKF